MRARIVAAAMVVAGVMVLAACPGRALYSVRPTPSPGWADSAAIAGLDSVTLAAYVAGLEFDTTDGVWDEQRLMVIESGTKRHSVLARMEPEIGAARLTRPEVERGVIIARVIITAPDERTGLRTYHKLGVVDTLSYLYVRKFPAVGTRAEYWGAYMLGASGRSRVPLRLDVLNHPRRYRNLAIARWQWSESDERAWGTCGPDCCAAWLAAPGTS